AGRIEMMIGSRGRHSFPFAHVSSLFPFGFFRKGVRYRVALEVLVFPEVFPEGATRLSGAFQQGEDASRRAGWGHDLHDLRAFRHGDDPRGIHWKQTARTGRMIFTERTAEHSRRLSILFDNGVGTLATPELASRFVRLVSEAATAAVDHLARGFDVEVVTREGSTGFASGLRQRLALLELLARVEPVAADPEPLRPSDLHA